MTSDEVYLEVKFSFNYFVYIIKQLVGPVTFLITLISYRIKLYEILCKKKYKQFPTQFAQQNKKFYITIPVIGNQLEFYMRAWKILQFNILKEFSDIDPNNFFSYFADENMQISKSEELEKRLNSIIEIELQEKYGLPDDLFNELISSSSSP